jgi:hypothetical protein
MRQNRRLAPGRIATDCIRHRLCATDNYGRRIPETDKTDSKNRAAAAILQFMRNTAPQDAETARTCCWN